MLKTFLKNARKALSEQNNEFAISQCESALEIDQKSYNAYVFLGLAYTNLNDLKTAEDQYNRAITLDEQNVLGWQGILSVHEKSGHLTKYIDASSRLALAQLEALDLDRCLKTLEKAVDLAKEKGSTTEITQALKLYLPISPFFQALQDRLPDAADTYEELCSILEEQEKTSISTNIAKGRSRLGVKLEQLTIDVKQDIYATSELENIYTEIINWSHEESVRREAERKLLAHAVNRLMVSNSCDKPSQCDRVINIARGMTIVKIADPLAWKIVLDWTDLDHTKLDLSMLNQFISLFPNLLFPKALQAYILCTISPFTNEQLDRFYNKPEDQGKQKLKGSVKLDEVLLQLTQACDSEEDVPALCSRLLLHSYCEVRDWAVAVDTAESLLEKVKRVQVGTSLELVTTVSCTNLALATALTYYRAPRFHARALELVELIQTTDERLRNLASVCKARILRMDGDPERAQALLEKIVHKDEHNYEAELEMAQCHIMQRQASRGLSVLNALKDHALLEQSSREMLANIFYYIGQCQINVEDGKDDAYESFIQSLKYDQNMACTYTALGLYYADVVRDARRAEKCFQKALELSSAEIVAAERLASAFANTEDWELVEIIAQRVIQGNEQLRVAWPYRAAGLVYLHQSKHQFAISAFQMCLRLSSKDIDAWIGLGESYMELGRYQASKKAFARAMQLDSENWHAKYLSASVLSIIGEHEDACALLKIVVQTQDTSSVKVSLCLAYLNWSKALLSSGWISRASVLLTECLSLAASVLQEAESPRSTLEVLAKAAELLSHCTTLGESHVHNLLPTLEKIVDRSNQHQLQLPDLNNQDDRCRLLLVAVYSFLRCLDQDTYTDYDRAVIWYKIGQILQSLGVQTTESTPEGRETSFQRCAITCFQCAIRLKPEDDAYWGALGIASASYDQRLAHHCLIKAAVLGPKSVSHWTNLGYFYYKNHNIDAASAAFTSAQTLDPSSALAWLGQACIAHDLDEHDHELFEHALSLANTTRSPIFGIKFVESMFNSTPGSTQRLNQGTLPSCIWPLTQSMKVDGLTPTASNHIKYLNILLLERSSDYVMPLDECVALAEALEAQYEIDESTQTLGQYCDVKATLARLQLRSNLYEEAGETASSVVELEPENNRQSLLSCQIVIGLSQYFTGQHDEAIASLRDIYRETDQNPEVLALLCQVMLGIDKTNATAPLKLLQGGEGHLKTDRLKLLLAATIAVHQYIDDATAPSDPTLVQVARDALTHLHARDQSKTTTTTREVREVSEVVERLLGRDRAVVQAQLHMDPTSVSSWLTFARKANNSRDVQEDMHATQESMIGTALALASDDPIELASVCRASSSIRDRMVAMHLCPGT